jgi:hypothetical protein
MKFIVCVLLTYAAVGAVSVSSGARGIDGCYSEAYVVGPGVILICPQGDGETLADKGLTISVTVRDNVGVPVPGIPAQDFWLIGCEDLITLCNGVSSIDATGPTDANGMTTFTGTIAGSGCDASIQVVAQGYILRDENCLPLCLPVAVRSPDQKSANGGGPDGIVTSADFAYFGISYQSPPKPYNACHDFVGAPYGTITLADFARFGAHYGHGC